MICAVYDHAAVIHLIFAARHDLSEHAREQHNNEQKCRYAEHGLFVDLYSGALLFRLHGGFGGRRLLLFHFLFPLSDCLELSSGYSGIILQRCIFIKYICIFMQTNLFRFHCVFL